MRPLSHKATARQTVLEINSKSAKEAKLQRKLIMQPWQSPPGDPHEIVEANQAQNSELPGPLNHPIKERPTLLPLWQRRATSPPRSPHQDFTWGCWSLLLPGLWTASELSTPRTQKGSPHSQGERVSTVKEEEAGVNWRKLQEVVKGLDLQHELG